MATATPYPSRSVQPAALPGRRFDNVFFSSMAVLMFVTVFVGFAPTYYLAGLHRAPLPSPIIHVHGAIFSSWILLLIAQTALVATHRVRIHRRLGVAGFILACFMVVSGLAAATNSLARNFSPVQAVDPRFFYLIPTSDMLVFAVLIGFAFVNRSNPAAHKRLIYVATSGLLIAAIVRWPVPFVNRNAPHAAWMVYVFLLLLATYDFWATRRVHRATLWGSAFLIFIYEVRLPIGKTAAWQSFAGWVQSLVS